MQTCYLSSQIDWYWLKEGSWGQQRPQRSIFLSNSLKQMFHQKLHLNSEVDTKGQGQCSTNKMTNFDLFNFSNVFLLIKLSKTQTQSVSSTQIQNKVSCSWITYQSVESLYKHWNVETRSEPSHDVIGEWGERRQNLNGLGTHFSDKLA